MDYGVGAEDTRPKGRNGGEMKAYLTYEDLDFHNRHPSVRFSWDGMGTGCPVCDQFCQAIQPQLLGMYKEWKGVEK